MRTPQSIYWQYRADHLDQLPDPRIQITRQMDWTVPSDRTGTLWAGCEPDNYNLAIFDSKPHDLVFMQDQCFYLWNRQFKRQTIQGWVSIYRADERLQTQLFNQYVVKNQPRAAWRFAQAKLLRTRRPMLVRENNYSNRSDDTFTTDERLWQMGYYQNLKTKYRDEAGLNQRVGQPRRAVECYRPTEENNQDDLDFLLN